MPRNMKTFTSKVLLADQVQGGNGGNAETSEYPSIMRELILGIRRASSGARE
jgi:hypothetical protein